MRSWLSCDPICVEVSVTDNVAKTKHMFWPLREEFQLKWGSPFTASPYRNVNKVNSSLVNTATDGCYSIRLRWADCKTKILSYRERERVRGCRGGSGWMSSKFPSDDPPPSPAGWRRTPATFPPPPHSRKQLASHRWLLDLPKRINFFQAKSRHFFNADQGKNCFIYYWNYLRLNNSKFWRDNPKWIF